MDTSFQKVQDLYLNNILLFRLLFLSNIILCTSIYWFIPHNGYDGPNGLVLGLIVLYVGIPVLIINLVCLSLLLTKVSKKVPFLQVVYQWIPFCAFIDIPLIIVGITASIACIILLIIVVLAIYMTFSG